jgi:hypothetical protein
MEAQPAKRGPGRPRKAPVEAAQPEKVQELISQPEKPEVKFDSSDEWIGQAVDEGVHGIMLPDGREYRCADGVVVERLNG